MLTGSWTQADSADDKRVVSLYKQKPEHRCDTFGIMQSVFAYLFQRFLSG